MRPFSTPVSPAKFFTLTFILSWLIWIPLALSHFHIGPFQIPEVISNIVRLLGVLMPAASAVLLTARNGGRSAIRGLLSRLALWRVHWKWWLAAVLVQPILLGTAGLAVNWLSGRAEIHAEGLTSMGALIANVIFLLIATLGEEIGWRGVALPALQQRHRAAQASVILGLLWATWHLPFWLLLDTFDQFGLAYIGMNFLFVLPLTFYITWFFNHAQYSILLAVMFHLTFNTVNTALFPVTTQMGAFGILIVLECIVALIISGHLEPEEATTISAYNRGLQ
jgi:membrane protease YdiL (CAAX protease family)